MGMQLIETIEVGSGGAASIEFTSIPQDGVDLLLVASLRSQRAAIVDDSQLKLNNVGSGDPYEQIELRGNGSSAASNAASGNWFRFHGVNGASATTDTFSSHSLLISNYTSSDVKSMSYDVVSENNASTAYQYIEAAKANVTSAVTSIQLDESSVFEQHSTISLYKITAD